MSGKPLTQKAKKSPHATKSREELSAERRREHHQLRVGMPLAREKARGQLGRGATIVLDLGSPTETRCRVGVKEHVLLSRFLPTVPCVQVRGAGATWEQALDEARRGR